MDGIVRRFAPDDEYFFEEGQKGSPFSVRQLKPIQMPNMDGFETTHNIRTHEDEKTAKIPIIAMTAHAMREDREKCLAAGMNGYLSKPIETKVFMEVIDKILSDTRPI